MKKSLAFLKLLLFVFFLTIIYPVGYYVLQDNHHLALKYYAMENSANYSDIGAYIINLEKSPQRYKRVSIQVKELGMHYERISAIGGSNLAEDDLAEKVDLMSFRNFSGRFPKKGVIGCSLSHIKAWRQFLASDLEFGLFFEDDVWFNPSELKSVIADLLKKTHKWDIINLEPSPNTPSLNIASLSGGQQLKLYLRGSSHASAYILNREAALALLSKAMPIKMPIDEYLNRSWEFNLIYTGLENPKIVKQSLHSTEISSTESIYSAAPSSGIEGWMYNLQTSYICFAYNLGIYVFSFIDDFQGK